MEIITNIAFSIILISEICNALCTMRCGLLKTFYIRERKVYMEREIDRAGNTKEE